MYHYRITILCHWKDLSSTSVVVYRISRIPYTESFELHTLETYELSLPTELRENLMYLTVDTVNYLGNSNAT
jgi:hypothetical protein